MANVCVSLFGKGMAQRAGYTLFLGMTIGVSPEENTIWIHELSKLDAPLQCGWASSKPLRTWLEQKGRGRLNLFSAWMLSWDIPFLLSLVLLVHPLSEPDWVTCREKIRVLLGFYNCMSQYDIINNKICIYYCFSLSGESWLIKLITSQNFHTSVW